MRCLWEAILQVSYGSGKTWKTWKIGMILKKSGKKSGKTRKMGKSQGKYFACHDQYFSCVIMEKFKKILVTVKKLPVIFVCQRLNLGKSFVVQPIFLENVMFSATKSRGKVRENQNEILPEPCSDNISCPLEFTFPSIIRMKWILEMSKFLGTFWKFGSLKVPNFGNFRSLLVLIRDFARSLKVLGTLHVTKVV